MTQRITFFTITAFLLAGASGAQTQPAVTPAPRGAQVSPAEDAYLWLEEVESPRAMAWVKSYNTKSLGFLQSDPRYERYHAEALKILEATDRIATPQFRGHTVYNFWQDPTHVRGILRRTTLESYRTANPKWTVVLDVDSLSAKENANWVYRGANCLRPADRLCMITLSNGGKEDRKSTRLNSSHLVISYAVFCL